MLVAVAGVLSGEQLVRRADETDPHPVELSERREEQRDGLSPGAMAALDAWRRAERAGRARAAEDTLLVLARGKDASARAGDPEQLSLAAAGVHGAAALVADASASPVVDAPQGGVLEVGHGKRRITHYLCRNPWGEGGYCEWMACRGLDGQPQRVGAGFVAGPSWRCGQQVEIGGIVFTYGDTGSWPIEADQVIDVACYGDDGDGSDPQWHWGWPGTPEYALVCPAFADYEEIEWLTP